MTGKIVRGSLTGFGTKTRQIQPGNPWESGYCESQGASYAAMAEPENFQLEARSSSRNQAKTAAHN
jgi:hypothetical protein